ncbi:MAG TPA: hypothetical protein VNG12_24880 [Acidimicrobiales bacterium]|nr:hypothetical protein [Acidimicrobiales bacterium]
MEIVKQCSPVRIVIKQGVRKANDITVYLRAHGELIQAWRFQTKRPSLPPLGKDVTIEIRVKVSASIVTPPTVSVQGRDGVSMVLRCLSVLHSQIGFKVVA